MNKKELRRMNIGVICGGNSPEREISLKTGKAVFSALKRLGYRVFMIPADKGLERALLRLKINVVFNALHGGYGENGCVQGMLEVMGLPYTGSGVLASGLCMDKKKTKDILTANGIPTPEYYSIKFQGADFKCRMSLPVVVKPSDSGSSIGVTIVRDKDLFAGAIRKAFRYSPEVIVEKYIPGKEVTVGILDDNAIGAMEVRTEKEFLSYNVKYTPGMEEFVIPPEIPQKALKQCLEYSLNAFRVLGCTGYGRIDTRVTPSGKVYILEINTLPGLTELSYLPKIAEWRNISYDALIEKILLTASLKGR